MARSPPGPGLSASDATAEIVEAAGYTTAGLASTANLQAQHYQYIKPLVVSLSRKISPDRTSPDGAFSLRCAPG